MKNMAWLIFIVAKSRDLFSLIKYLNIDRILQKSGDLVEFAYLLVAVLYIMVYIAP